MTKHFDVIIIGAGLSGICAGYYLQKFSPTKSYAILEARENLGGTWDLFTFPGIRSDASMLTMSYDFKPWNDPKVIAGGAAIWSYLRDTAKEFEIDRNIYFRHKVTSASWSTKDKRWTLVVSHEAKAQEFSCNFLFICAGYYRYDQGYLPQFNGIEKFRGKIIHPQHWPDGFEYHNKRIIVIGSGATAITLIPALAKKAKHVTMLQRSPSYILSWPERDNLLRFLHMILPTKLAYRLARWTNILLVTLFYKWTRHHPVAAKKLLIKAAREQLEKNFDVDTHLTPRYKPWDQRLCIAPEGDFYTAIREGKASIETDHITTFTASGLQLHSGKELEADVIVTATGLNAEFLGGIPLEVDGRQINNAEEVTYKGVMLNDVPNMVYAFGYINNSWTLKVELVCSFVCRLLNYMDKQGFAEVTPKIVDNSMTRLPLFADFTPGYVEREKTKIPKQGDREPWRAHQNYFFDLWNLRHGSLKEKELQYR